LFSLSPQLKSTRLTKEAMTISEFSLSHSILR
jgi:hypothetical protein